MTIKLKIECIYGRFLEDECIRVIALDDFLSLYDLHLKILESVDFDNDHLFAFFTANTPSPWAKRKYLTYEDDWEARHVFYDETILKDIWPLGRKKLYYRYDFGDDWVFEIRKMRSLKSDVEIKTPSILDKIGPHPEQYPYFGE
jgi:hypothetical protein